MRLKLWQSVLIAFVVTVVLFSFVAKYVVNSGESGVQTTETTFP